MILGKLYILNTKTMRYPHFAGTFCVFLSTNELYHKVLIKNKILHIVKDYYFTELTL